MNPRSRPRLAVALVAGVLLTGCGPDKPTPAQTPEPTARPGAYCQQASQRAVTDAGRPVVCTTTGSDDRLRWRADLTAGRTVGS